MSAVDSPSAPARPAPPSRPAPQRHARRKPRTGMSGGAAPYLLALPALAIILGLLGWPMIRMIVLGKI